MKIGVYKRTHAGDPCICGIFGANDCMGSQRRRNYEAVLGIGGSTAPSGMVGRLTWVGIRPSKWEDPSKRGPLVTFDHFCLMDSDGPKLAECAPTLWDEVKNIRRGIKSSEGLTQTAQTELHTLINEYQKCPPSSDTCNYRETGSCGGGNSITSLGKSCR